MATLETVSGPGPMRRRRGAELAEGWGRRLRRRLVAAGPLAARFGIYLGSRVDLLPGTDCLELLEIPDHGPASHPARVAEQLERELGGRPEELFEHFESEPLDSGLVFQWHRAVLRGGGTVVVELVHPELAAELEAGRLRRLAEPLTSSGLRPAVARAAVGEFQRQLDLLQTCAALEQLADETDDSHWFEVPRAHLRLCSLRVRVLFDPDGGPAEEGAEPAEREVRARRLARGWLALALGGHLFPTEPWGRNVRHLPDGGVAVLGGGTHRLPRTARRDLREYLAAVAAKDPARAALAFRDLLPDGATDRRLRDRLRHTDPFRDRSWDVGGDLFARQVLAHWRTASGLGYHPPDTLALFYRGLFLLNQESRRLVADATPVRDGLREARLLLLFDELREEAESGRWGGELERQLSLLSGLPQKLDRILTLAAEDGHAEGLADRRGGDGEPRRPGAGRAVAACLLGLTAVVLVVHHLAAAGGPGVWAERLGALLVLLLGALLLRTASRDDGG